MNSIKNSAAIHSPLPFPKLMAGNSGAVYLMTSNTHGTCIHEGDSGREVGDRVSNLSPDFLDDYYGSVTLSN